MQIDFSLYWYLQAEHRAKSVPVGNVPGLPDVIGNRKPIPSVDAPIFEGSNVADLQGFDLPNEDILEAKASMAMRWLLRHPKLCFMANTLSEQSQNMYA
jgi:hypothetical protein